MILFGCERSFLRERFGSFRVAGYCIKVEDSEIFSILLGYMGTKGSGCVYVRAEIFCF